MGKKFVGLDGLKHFWTIAKSWIAGRITGEVTARIAEVVADAPEDLDTLKEIADWISTHADSASEMNTQIQTNKDNIAANTSDISALQISVSEKANKVHSHDNRYYTESEIDTKLSGKSNTGHTHTKSQITDFPTSLPAKGGTADSATTAGTATTAAKLGRNGNTDIPMTFNWSGQGGQPSWLWGGNDGSNMYVYNPSNFSVNRASTAGTADKVASAGASTMWIYGRAKAICKTTSAGDNGGWKTLASIKTSSGSIEIGNLSGEDFIRIVYSSDADVNAGNNNVNQIMQLTNHSVEFPTAKASGKLVIPIGAPSSLEDGCIWIER